VSAWSLVSFFEVVNLDFHLDRDLSNVAGGERARMPALDDELV
jgi:hypothetical protein